MTIYCKLCTRRFHSDKPDDSAQATLVRLMSAHMGTHLEEARNLSTLFATASGLISTYLLLKLYVTIPAEEKTLLENFAKIENGLRDVLALETEATGAN